MIRSYLLIFTPVFAAGAFTGWVIPWWFRHWVESLTLAAETTHAADDLPVPYWPADPVDAQVDSWNCTWCRPKPDGRCTCSGKCGHIRCVAPRSLFTTADQEILEGKRLP